MKFKEIYTVAEEESRHILGFEDEYECDCIIECHMEIYGVPENVDGGKADDMINQPELALSIGTVDGYLIPAEEIERRGLDLYQICDDLSGDLEFMYSALSEEGGPETEFDIDRTLNIFYIHEIEIKKEYMNNKLFNTILMEVPEMVLAHYHIFPELLTYYPAPLPYEDKLREVKRHFATAAAAEVMERMDGGGIDEDDGQPHLIMTPEQIDMVMGRRLKGETYPESAKNLKIWELYEKAGFREWLNTRLLYRFMLEE